MLRSVVSYNLCKRRVTEAEAARDRGRSSVFPMRKVSVALDPVATVPVIAAFIPRRDLHLELSRFHSGYTYILPSQLG